MSITDRINSKILAAVLFVATISIFWLIFMFFNVEKPDIYDKSHKDCSFIYPPIRRYDYGNFIILLDRSRSVINEFNLRYHSFIKDISSRDFISSLLKDMKKEELNFKRYLARVRNLNGAGISNRRKRSLRYYVSVIEEYVDELEGILDRFL